MQNKPPAGEWYFRNANGVKGPLTEGKLRDLLKDADETSEVRQGNSQWVRAFIAKARFEDLDRNGIYLRSKDKIFGPFVKTRADDLQKDHPERFDAVKEGAHGEWKPLTSKHMPPPLPPASTKYHASHSKRFGKHWKIKLAVFGLWSFGMMLLGARVSKLDIGILTPLINAPSIDSRKLSKSEFQQRLRTIGLGAKKLSIIYEQVGKPSRTQNIGTDSYWYWDCKDGTMQLVLHKPLPNRGPIVGKEGAEYVTILAVNDY